MGPLGNSSQHLVMAEVFAEDSPTQIALLGEGVQRVSN